MKKTLILIVLSMMVILAVGQSAFAAPFTMTISDNDNSTTDITCSSNTGFISCVGSLGVWSLINVTAMSYPTLPNTAQFASMDLNGVVISSGAGQLNITLSDSGFISMPQGGTLTAGAGGTTNGSINFNASAGAASVNLPSAGQYAVGGFSGSGSAPTGPLPAPYSMTLSAQINHSSVAVTSFDLTGDIAAGPVPEPSALILLGTGLVGLAFRRRAVR